MYLGQQLAYLIIQELGLNRRIRSGHGDQVFESLYSCVSEILDKHTLLFNGMTRRIEVTHYSMFASVADELFEVSSDFKYKLLFDQ